MPITPAMLDRGCGVGPQTLHLADRIRPMVGDLAEPALPAASFDLVWSEGALYNIGIENALPVCRGLLRPAMISAAVNGKIDVRKKGQHE